VPSACLQRRIAGSRRAIESCISPRLFLSGNVEPASTLLYQADLVLYLVFEHFLRDHENHGLYWLRRGYLVLYLADLFPPEALIVGMLLAPFLDLDVPPPEISGIGLDPSPLALPLTLGPALGLLTTLLGLPGPRIRLVIPAAVQTPLLSSLFWFHIPILDRSCLCCLMEAYQGIKRIKDILSGAGIKGRIKVGPELIGIGSVLNIAYSGQQGHQRA